MTFFGARFISKKIGLLAGLVLISTLAATESCRADEWSRIQAANQRGQQASTAAGSLCPTQAAARTQIQNLASQITGLMNTYTQRDNDTMITDVQSDYQTLYSRFIQLGPKVDALQQTIGAIQGNINLLIQAVQGGLQPSQYPNVTVLLDQARAIHDAIDDVMEENDPLMSFVPKTSYAQWLAIANYKQNPDWYQQRDQKHVTLQDDLDTVMRQAYAIYGNRTSGAPISGPMYAQISQDFRSLGNALGPMMTKATTARQATDQLLIAMNAYPGAIRQHRISLAQDAENKANQIDAALQQAKSACTEIAMAKAETNALYGETKRILQPGTGTGLPYDKRLDKSGSTTKKG